MEMFCNQCEQAANGTGCNIQGVCGKQPEVAALQDHLLYGLKSLALYADKLGRNAKQVVSESRGAAGRNIEVIKKYA